MILPTEIRNRSGETLDHSFHPGTLSHALVILGHGLTGNKDRPLLVALADGLAALGWPCLRISYSGNGASQGRFEDSCPTKGTGDLQAVLDAVPAGTRIAYAGHSMGGAIGALTAATDPRLHVLISLAGMTHTAAFFDREFASLIPGRDFLWEEPEFPLSRNFADDLRNIGTTLQAASRVTQPWLFIHGSDDDLVPVKDSLDAHAATPAEKDLLLVPGAGHAFDPATYPPLVSAIERWLSRHLA